MVELNHPGWRRRLFVITDGRLVLVKGGKVFSLRPQDSLTFVEMWPAQDSYRKFKVSKEGRTQGQHGVMSKDGMDQWIHSYDWEKEEWHDGLDEYGLKYDL